VTGVLGGLGDDVQEHAAEGPTGAGAGTRRVSARPASMSCQWCTVAMDQMTVALASSRGIASAAPST
jgi:hypothetical protein